jgi:hypothetical protein
MRGAASAAFLYQGRGWPLEVPVEQELMNIMSQLTKEGIRMDVQNPNDRNEIFIAELPNGKQYLFTRTGMLKLRDEGKLNIMGIEEFGVTR